MRRILLALLLLTALATGCDTKLGTMPPVEVYFSPKGGCTEAVVRELNAAKQTVFVQAYSFTSKDIAMALDAAEARGVVVHVILDKSNLTENYSDADFIAHSGMSVLIDSKHAIAHNKIMIIDGQVVITGSFNFTTQAERLERREPAGHPRPEAWPSVTWRNWHDHEAHSEPYTGRGEVAERTNTEKQRRKR